MPDSLPARFFYGTVVNGKLQLELREAFQDLVKSFEGKKIQIQLGEQSVRRSLDQNSYLHGIVFPMMAEAAGYTPTEMKDELKKHFLSYPNEDGQTYLIRNTSELSVPEMTRFIEDCRRLAAELYHLNIPDPQYT